MALVLVPDAQFADMTLETETAGGKLEFRVYQTDDPLAIDEGDWAACDAVIVWHRMKIGAETLAKLTRCKIIVRVGVGFENVDIEACRRAGIPVCNVPNYGTTEIADHCLGLLLHLCRGIGVYDRNMRRDLARSYQDAVVPVSWRLRGKRFGVVGLGRIGTAIARRAAAFDMEVVFYDPYLPEGQDLATGFRRARSLTDLVAEADIVSLSTPSTAETRGMMNAAAFAAMKPGGILLNIARGNLVDLDALHQAMRDGIVQAAGLDVLPNEPPVPLPALIQAWQDQAPWLEGRLVLTPHAAFYSPAAAADMRTMSVEIAMSYLFGGQLRNNVNPGWNRQ